MTPEESRGYAGFYGAAQQMQATKDIAINLNHEISRIIMDEFQSVIASKLGYNSV